MSERSEDLPDEVVDRIVEARQKAETESKWVGLGLMALGAVSAMVFVLSGNEVTMLGAAMFVVVILTGGLLFNPKVYQAIVYRGIDALPGGKN